MSSQTRQEALDRLSRETFDLVIVGGGITGACLALDASSRGLKTALLEKSDFGQATSSASSKLLHGGIRFLQQLRFDKVRESAFERVYFQNLVPHLCRYVSFLVPTFRGLRTGKFFLGSGAIAYSVLSAGQNRVARHDRSRVPRPEILSREAVLKKVPWLGGDWPGTGALLLPECHMNNSERVTLSLIRAATETGCVACNYVSVDAIEAEKRTITGVRAHDADGRSLEISTDSVVNCAGPWLTRVNEIAGQSQQSPITSFFRGSHLVLRDVPLDCALALPTPQKIQGIAGRGGRHVFLIPWRGHVLLGTSYARHTGDIEDVSPTNGDAEQLLDAVNSSLGRKFLSSANIAHAFAGLYPITADEVEADVYQGASDYVFTDHSKAGGARGYFSAFGAKYTTARKLAEVTCDAIIESMGFNAGSCKTRTATVPFADVPSLDDYERALAHEWAGHFPHLIRHLVGNYGTDAEKILHIIDERPHLERPVSEDRRTVAAEAVFACRHEWVEHLADFVFRRTGLGTIGHPGTEAIDRCARLVGDERNWSDDRIEEETAATVSLFPYPPGETG